MPVPEMARVVIGARVRVQRTAGKSTALGGRKSGDS
jgi:hypothetical protein